MDLSKPLKVFHWCMFFKSKNFLLFCGLLIAIGASELLLRLSGIVRDVGPSITQYDPVYGKLLKKHFKAKRTTPEFTMHYSINSLGFRGPEPESFPYNPLLFLGDSFTEGYGVTDGEEFPEVVRQLLLQQNKNAASPVVNAGIGNSGNGYWIKFLQREGKQFDPKLIVLQFCGNDFWDNRREKYFALSPTNDLIELPIPPPNIQERIKNIVELFPGLSRSYFVGFGYQVLHSFKHSIYFSFGQEKKRKNSGKLEKMPENQIGRFEDSLTFRLWEETLTICQQEQWPVFAILVNMAVDPEGWTA
ncbi:SGNH/GDSL hydrolase family protein [Thermodesulfobacteriota bacterium]